MLSLNDSRRDLPAVGKLLQDPKIAKLAESHGSTMVSAAVRVVVQRARNSDSGVPVNWVGEVCAEVSRMDRPSLRRIINATGVLLHTNLGRAPLPKPILSKALELGSGYVNLEYDLEKGERGSRYVHCVEALRLITGAEDALVVNNNAAAVLLVLRALARGREVIISRGELVEIGGSFRIPEILELSGAKLREVGTTNRTRISDYEQAIGKNTGLLLKVHPSNYRIEGFTESVPPSDLADLARRYHVPFVMDWGTGILRPLEGSVSPPTVKELFQSGVDVLTLSGDKLLGGPQAGIILGRRSLLELISSDPWLRVVRVDKITLALLEAIVRSELEGKNVSVIQWMLERSLKELRQEAEQVVVGLSDVRSPFVIEAKETQSAAGGGSLPQEEIPSWGVQISGPEGNISGLEKGLRAGEPPVIVRRKEGSILFDLRTVFPEEIETLTNAVRTAAIREGEVQR